MGLTLPPSNAIYASRVDHKNHGQVFAAMGFFGNSLFGLGGIAGTYIWSTVLYDGSEVAGWRAGLPFFLIVVIMVAALILNVALYLIYIRPRALECQEDLSPALRG